MPCKSSTWDTEIRGFDRVAALRHLWEMTPKDAHERLRILRFWDTHGLLATLEAFEVSRQTLTRWKAELRGGMRPPSRPRVPPAGAGAGPTPVSGPKSAVCVLSTQPGQGEAPRLAGPLVRGARPSAALGLHDRADHRPRARSRCVSPPLVWTLGAVPDPSEDARSPGNPPEPTPRPLSAWRWIPSSVFVTVFDATS